MRKFVIECHDCEVSVVLIDKHNDLPDDIEIKFCPFCGGDNIATKEQD